jgi:hypothetical protein
MPRLLRSIVAVVLGYLLFAFSAVVLFRVTARDPHAVQSFAFELLTVAYGIAFAALGGYTAARLAPDHPARHAAIMAALLALGATVSLIAAPGPGATWTQWCALLLMAPSALLAGRLSKGPRSGS